MKEKRRATHRKLINSISKNNKTLKKNKPAERTTLKCKRDTFNPNDFAYFLEEDSEGA